MINQINGRLFHDLIDYGIRNLALRQDYVNALNVFPVPDGDTGTNMVMTLHNGFLTIESKEESLSELARRFAGAVVFGARGNSGVIVSQFFKGFSEGFFDREEADCRVLAAALERGVESAYGAVSHPVEGTILTVLREATETVARKVEAETVHTVNGLIDAFLAQARVSLERTPELLPVLRSAGVVDSGGAGLVYIFEGMKKCLSGEPLEAIPHEREAAAVDYSRFDSKSQFEYGYCTELLIQLTNDKAPFDRVRFSEGIALLGDSLVTAFEGDKIKVHIHSFTPERVLGFCHEFGEFLSLKIENMSVQHHERTENIQVSLENACEHFSIVAVAHDPSMKQRFLDMGADAVIGGDRRCPPSASDFLEAFETTGAKTILVFPNSKNTELAAEQAKKLYEDARIVIFHTHSDAECYAALPMIDFDETDMELLAASVRKTVENVYAVELARSQKDTSYGGREIREGDMVAVSGTDVLAVGNTVAQVAADAILQVMNGRERDILTVFAGPGVTEEERCAVTDFVAEHYAYTEVSFVETEDDFYPLVLSFE